MKMRITRERPGKKIEEVEAIELLDNQGKELAHIIFSDKEVSKDPNAEVGTEGPYRIIIATRENRLWIDVAHPFTQGEWTRIPAVPRG